MGTSPTEAVPRTIRRATNSKAMPIPRAVMAWWKWPGVLSCIVFIWGEKNHISLPMLALTLGVFLWRSIGEKSKMLLFFLDLLWKWICGTLDPQREQNIPNHCEGFAKEFWSSYVPIWHTLPEAHPWKSIGLETKMSIVWAFGPFFQRSLL